MRKNPFVLSSLFAASLLVMASVDARASEYGFTSYGLGGSAFGAGVTPPPGTYVTAVTGFYSGDAGRGITFGGVVINAGAEVEVFTSGLNVLYVPDRRVLGGNLGLSVTVPFGHIDIEATIGIGPLVVSREVDGWGLGDIVPRAQLGWQHGEFAHTAYLQVVTPTGRWGRGSRRSSACIARASTPAGRLPGPTSRPSFR